MRNAIRFLNNRVCQFAMFADIPFLFVVTGSIELWLDK